MHPTEEYLDGDNVDSGTESLTKHNLYNTDIRDRMIKHATEIKFVKTGTLYQ